MNESVNDVMDKLNYTEISMLKRNKIILAIAAASVAISTQSFAEESVSSAATVTVQNSFTFAETAALSFGIITVTAGAASDFDDTDNPVTAAIYTVGADGSVNVPEGNVDGGYITRIQDGTPASFEISNAARFTKIDLTFPTESIHMRNPIARADGATFKLKDFTAADADGNSINIASGVADDAVETDESGIATFTVGASITTTPGSYTDGEFVGNYTVRANY